ncbi:MAG: IS200/IS605 family transposase [Cyanobacteria bacterium P01_E01_bin.45]
MFCVKYRRKLLKSKERYDYLKYILKEIGERYSFELEEMGTDGDHIHVFVGAAPKYAPSRAVQILKSISAREMLKEFPEIRKPLWGGGFWSDGGYIGTVGGGLTGEIVKRYGREQGSRETQESEEQV